MSFLSFFFIVVGVPFLLSLIIAGAAVWFKEPDDAYDDHQPTHGASPGVCDGLTAPSVSNRSG